MASIQHDRGLTAALGLLLAAGIAWADEAPAPDDNPYASIVVRNPFGLREAPPTPPPVAVPTPPAIPPPKVILTGITDLGGVPRALLEITPHGKPLERPVLGEGERSGKVEVLEIDAVRNQVRCRIGDEESTLAVDFDKPGTPPAQPPKPVRIRIAS